MRVNTMQLVDDDVVCAFFAPCLHLYDLTVRVDPSDSYDYR